MALMDTTDFDRDVAVRRNAAANHAQRLLRSPSSNSISGPSNWVIALTLAATRGAPRTWRQFETLAGYLKELGIVEYRVNTAEFAPGAAAGKPDDKRSATASDRMKRAHQAAAYDTWFRKQVQASIDDPRPSLSDSQARDQMAARREALLKNVGTRTGGR